MNIYGVAYGNDNGCSHMHCDYYVEAEDMDEAIEIVERNDPVWKGQFDGDDDEVSTTVNEHGKYVLIFLATDKDWLARREHLIDL